MQRDISQIELRSIHSLVDKPVNRSHLQINVSSRLACQAWIITRHIMRERVFKRFEIYYQLKFTLLYRTFNFLDFFGSQSHL
jgi:hypothetical protein